MLFDDFHRHQVTTWHLREDGVINTAANRGCRGGGDDFMRKKQQRYRRPGSIHVCLLKSDQNWCRAVCKIDKCSPVCCENITQQDFTAQIKRSAECLVFLVTIFRFPLISDMTVSQKRTEKGRGGEGGERRADTNTETNCAEDLQQYGLGSILPLSCDTYSMFICQRRTQIHTHTYAHTHAIPLWSCM